jgi:hypothetical protein
VSGLVGNVGKLREFERGLRRLPVTLAQRLAAASAGAITSLARQTFAAGENAYGDPWAPGEHGEAVTLRRSGRLAGGVAYVAIGTRLRAKLGPKYARYQIGKRPVFPRAGAHLPIAYIGTLRAKAGEIIRADLKGAG